MLAYLAAALAEIAGCFAFWAWLRLDKSPWWLVPGMASLALFAYLLTLLDAEHAGRTYAAYGGVYITASIFWLWAIEGAKPHRWDSIGTAVCLTGAAIILFGPRDYGAAPQAVDSYRSAGGAERAGDKQEVASEEGGIDHQDAEAREERDGCR